MVIFLREKAKTCLVYILLLPLCLSLAMVCLLDEVTCALISLFGLVVYPDLRTTCCILLMSLTTNKGKEDHQRWPSAWQINPFSRDLPSKHSVLFTRCQTDLSVWGKKVYVIVLAILSQDCGIFVRALFIRSLIAAVITFKLHCVWAF